MQKTLVNSEANHLAPLPDALADIQLLVTEGIGDSDIVGGDFTQFALGLRQQAVVEVSNDVRFAQHQTAIKITMRADVVPLRATAFSLLQGVTS